MAENLSPRTTSGLNTVRQWESDKELLKECRDQIPFHLLCPEQYHHLNAENIEESPYAKPDDDKYQGDDLLLKRLTLYFKEIMTWVNNPPCALCGCADTKGRNTRGPISPEEREGQATRVEVYWCPTCNAETTLFPRYNLPRKLLETKKGRCGEYANLFGMYCRAAGFDTRYILDFTDHVWTEVYSQRIGRWIMCDSCEGLIDVPSMYEKGWGKDLNCVLAFTTDSVVDVTRRYTRKFKSQQFQERRRPICPGGEIQSGMIIAQFNANLRHSNRMPKKRIDELDQRMSIEKTFLEATEKMDSWEGTDYSEGRQSGSLAWKISRGEAGNVSSVQNNGTNATAGSTTVVELSAGDMADLSSLKLRCEDDTVPSTISMRLPDFVMSFAIQETASDSAKKEAFLKFINNEHNDTAGSTPFIGYCTKQGLPVYLITNAAYPFQKSTDSKGNHMKMWKTYHFVPESLSGESDDTSNPSFDVPIDEDFFSNLIGESLVKNSNGQHISIATASSLSNARLVAFYFSAHWCPPCRQFTPMLCELYLHLKSAFPTHGLEICFVSSDRDHASFYDYFRSMPWLAVPFDNAPGRRSISERYEVQGIPALVVVDTISGNVVISKETSRSEVALACRGGDDAIEQMFRGWLDQIPNESKEMMDMLKLSCIEEKAEKESSPTASNAANTNTVPMTKEEQTARIHVIFAELVSEGLKPNEAALKAIQQVSEEVKASKQANDVQQVEVQQVEPEDKFEPKHIDREVVSLVMKYIDNVEKNPSTVRFRNMRLGNKIFDHKITSTKDGLRFIQHLGFHIFSTDIDYYAALPLSANIASMKKYAEELLDNEDMIL